MNNEFLYRHQWDWKDTDDLEPKTYTCYRCGETILSKEGYKCMGNSFSKEECGKIYICHNCKSPTYFIYDRQVPGVLYGNTVEHLPDDINFVYEEARKCFSVDAFTSSVLCCRKILMNIACNKGAKKGESFEFYVNYLNDSGYIPPDGKIWVDKIRKLGNQATHKLEMKSKEEAELAIKFTAMLLKIIYEFPKLLEV